MRKLARMCLFVVVLALCASTSVTYAGGFNVVPNLSGVVAIETNQKTVVVKRQVKDDCGRPCTITDSKIFAYKESKYLVVQTFVLGVEDKDRERLEAYENDGATVDSARKRTASFSQQAGAILIVPLDPAETFQVVTGDQIVQLGVTFRKAKSEAVKILWGLAKKVVRRDDIDIESGFFIDRSRCSTPEVVQKQSAQCDYVTLDQLKEVVDKLNGNLANMDAAIKQLAAQAHNHDGAVQNGEGDCFKLKWSRAVYVWQKEEGFDPRYQPDGVARFDSPDGLKHEILWSWTREGLKNCPEKWQYCEESGKEVEVQ